MLMLYRGRSLLTSSIYTTQWHIFGRCILIERVTRDCGRLSLLKGHKPNRELYGTARSTQPKAREN